ncbi:hypothetical protein M413DRAFT_445532 [Hebeloma cylindrosporum]|uniref:Pterin-binding domain-containing protein n=1 Tax=Hebeloma cylindrosporum TaxID=76867 RepID=A0A0C2XV81_HEBCY|nr:hypothetical protein M413DRAFT_445532 [Hebeloma cylindrosporum h7]
MALYRAGTEDIIRVNDLVIPVSLHTGAQWPTESDTPVEQLVSISLSIFHDVSKTAETDDLKFSINYSEIAKRIRTAVASKTFVSLQELSRYVCQSAGPISPSDDALGSEICVKVKQLKGPLHAKTIAIEHLAKRMPNGSWTHRKINHIVEDLTCPIIVGINPAERLERQNVVVNLSVDTGDQGLERGYWLDFRNLIKVLYEDLSVSNFQTLEALTSSVASKTLQHLANSYPTTPTVSVRVAKPSALTLAGSAEVEICRTDAQSDVPSKFTQSVASTFEHPKNGLATVAIALGSNLGDSFRNIEYALRLLEIPEEILEGFPVEPRPVLAVVNTSFLYETAPMYVTDQPSFINCACIVETNLSPPDVLELIKRIEFIVGRVPSIRNGPRAVDLDIIFYDHIVFDALGGTRYGNRDVVIPHPRVQEREFVLRPLNDMIPGYIHPVLKKTVAILLQDIYDPTGRPMNKVLPIPRYPISPTLSSPYSSIPPVPETLTHWTYPSDPSMRTSYTRKTHIMATLNVTPDSFSDGAKHDALPAALQYVSSSVAAGATIIDVGGYSTRPGAAFVSVEDEVARVVPAIKAIRDAASLETLSSPQPNDNNDVAFSDDLVKRIVDLPISMDTFRWEVAEAGINAGANCINDVYAFTGPDSWPLSPAGTEKGDREALYMSKLKAVARQYAVPVVLMHSRGEAGKNKDYGEYAYAEDTFGRGAVLEGVRVELGAKVDQIVLGKGGVRRWLVVADPGIGFSKSLNGNLEVLRSARDVVAGVKIGDKIVLESHRNPLRGYPQLIGVSRKSFLGAILAQDPEGRETEPKERTWATAAAVSCAVQQGALIVRVHDVKEMADVIKVADALW